MVVISYAGKEANAKIVYYGPGLGGKTTNLEFIYDSVPSSSRGKMVSMKTQTDRTLFFDFLPLDLGELGGFKTRFLLYTVPGQVFYNATRKLVLRGADAIAFIADSQIGKMDENKESLANLVDNLADYDLSLDGIPWVIQYNKRDLPDIHSIDELNKELNARNVPYFEAIATEGVGVFETFRGLSKLLLEKLSEEIGQRLVMTKHIGPKIEEQRARAAAKILMEPITEIVEVPEEGEAVQPAEAVELAEAAGVPEAVGFTEAVEDVEELEPQLVETAEAVDLAGASDIAAQDTCENIVSETEPELAEVALEELDLAPAAVDTPMAQTETPGMVVTDSQVLTLEAPGVELLREHEAVPNFFARSLGSSRLELERDTAHFAEAHDYAAQQGEPEPVAASAVTLEVAEPVIRPEPARQSEPARAIAPMERAGEDAAEEELSFLSIIRRNNVGVFGKDIAHEEAEPSQKPAAPAEVLTERRSIESSIEIPLPLKQGEKMEEITLTIRIRLKPFVQATGVTEHEFMLDGISR